MSNFALLGAAGFIAPRHLKAIKDTGNSLCAAYDPFDSVGIMDSYFPNAVFFKEFELFDRYLSRLEQEEKIDYISICTPNYLHDSHIRYGLRTGASVICEKPLLLNPKDIDELKTLEKESRRKVNTILQLRLHEAIIKLREEVLSKPTDEIFDIDLTYITSRGAWYHSSWKGDINKSGGIATNIGVHFYDMLCWIFGKVTKNIVHVSTSDRVSGYLELERARVRYFLSVNYNTIPPEIRKTGKRTYRSLNISGREIEFSEGFTELHTASYQNILAGKGFGLEDVRNCIEIVHEIRNATPIGLKGNYHYLAYNV